MAKPKKAAAKAEKFAFEKGDFVVYPTHGVGKVIDIEANYLFLDSEDLETGKALPYRSQHNVTGTVTAMRGLAAVDLRYRSRVEEVIGYPLDPRSSIFTLDLRGAYQAFGLTFLAGIRNLFNTFYTDVQERTPGAPRQWSLGVYSEF